MKLFEDVQQFFGINIAKVPPAEDKSGTIGTPLNDDGSTIVSPSIGGAYYGVYMDIDGAVKSDIAAIAQYRQMALYPEVDVAIQDIVNEAIPHENDTPQIDVILDDLDISDDLKIRIENEFKDILAKLKYTSMSSDIFRRWYVDGRLFYQIIVDKANPKRGIVELRPLEATKIRKVKELIREKTPMGVDVVKDVVEYYVYNEAGFGALTSTVTTNTSTSASVQGIKISPDSVIYCPSGHFDTQNQNGNCLSYLHKAIRPINQLRMLEDATVVYTIARAPERRIFYVDVGNLPKLKAEQYVKDLMNRYRNKIVYDSATGAVRDDKKFMSLLEDFWMPRRDGCFSLDTKIKLLDGRDVELGQLIVEHKLGKINWVYSIDDNGHIVPGKISWAGVTRNNAEVIKVHLDNNEIITCTPDHKFILRNGEKIQAKDLAVGSSLMPFNTRMKNISNKEYLQVQHNDTEKFETLHSLVSNYCNRLRESNEVIHHNDFNRFNNNPENLVILDKQEHLNLHTRLSKNNWLVADVNKWKENLSTSGKRFFETDAGHKRKQEISEFNLTSESVWNGLKVGREVISNMRKLDKENLSHKEYLAKWSPGLSEMIDKSLGTKAFVAKMNYLRDTLPKDEYTLYCKKFGKSAENKYNRNTTGVELNKVISIVIANSNSNKEIQQKLFEYHSYFKNIKAVRRFLSKNGYSTISDCIYRNNGELNLKRKVRYKFNHIVTKIEFVSDKIDVGTLTIDEHHEYHDYHNFALSSGVFVMNSKGTSIETLPGATNLQGQIDVLVQFQEKMYQALNVPISRMKADTGFSIGRGNEITRDELKFQKFIEKLRRKFSVLFYETLKIQLILKGIINNEEWEEIVEKLRFRYQRDNYFAELKNQDIWNSRIMLLQGTNQYIGNFFSKQWIQKNVLQLTDEDIEKMKEEIDSEKDDPTAQFWSQQQMMQPPMMGQDPSMMGGDPGMQGGDPNAMPQDGAPPDEEQDPNQQYPFK